MQHTAAKTAKPRPVTIQQSATPGVTDQVVSYVGEFILGGIALLALYVAYWAIKQLKTAKDDHIAALNVASDKREEANEKHALAYQATANATVAAIEKLTTTETAQTDAIKDNTRALTDLRGAVNTQNSTLDSIVRDAVRRGSNWTPPTPQPSGVGE